MAREPIVLFSHSYAMPEARRGWELGEYPGHHLWGTVDLHGVGRVVDLPGIDDRRSPVGSFGVLRHQWRALAAWARHPRRVVCFTGEHSTLGTLLVLRRLHIGPRIVAVVHEAHGGRVARAGLPGASAVISLSSQVTAELPHALGVDPGRIRTLPWGPDLTFAGYRRPPHDERSPFVLSAGKAERDLPTLLGALARTGLRARVHVPADVAAPLDMPPSVSALDPPAPRRPHGPLTYADILPTLREAAVVAIPLARTDRLYGLTELNDALALGTPVVMTRNPYIDCDLEAVGCGIWVEPGDVDGWAAALERLMTAPALRAEMGARGRAFAERSWNATLFGAGVGDAIRSVEGDREGQGGG